MIACASCGVRFASFSDRASMIAVHAAGAIVRYCSPRSNLAVFIAFGDAPSARACDDATARDVYGSLSSETTSGAPGSPSPDVSHVIETCAARASATALFACIDPSRAITAATVPRFSPAISDHRDLFLIISRLF